MEPICGSGIYAPTPWTNGGAFQGPAFTYEDFTDEQIDGLIPELRFEAVAQEAGTIPKVTQSGEKKAPIITIGIPKGDKGDPLKFEEMTMEQIQALIPNIYFDVKTLESDADATVEQTGTKDRPVVILGIPRGIQGIQGIQGGQGIQGEKGDKGDKGDQGEKGDKGSAFTFSDLTDDQIEALRGPRGYRGEQGEPGPQGEKGDPMTFEQLTLDQLYALIPDLHFKVALIGENEQPRVTTSGTKARVELLFELPSWGGTTDQDFVEVFENALNGA